jgi:hypothetical protein
MVWIGRGRTRTGALSEPTGVKKTVYRILGSLKDNYPRAQ